MVLQKNNHEEAENSQAKVLSASGAPNRKEPDRRIHPRAIPAWRIAGGLGSLFYWILPVMLSAMLWESDWYFLVYIVAAAVVIHTGLQFTVIPYVRWRHWRYSFDEDEIDLKRGILVIIRTLIPIKRVQHVDTRQGPILRHFGLATVTISTAATTHEIPALSEDVADEVRNNISNFARLAKDDDV